ncbi:hypothetical protein [Ferruginibacter albus]|uniref:hypothetical protein n=1 Tax=Ferruginibacter albus TaxID=2875540 RepID=UPI001CC47051|nr:hypothetical protein [Ferruginibacter albus]UAY53414.1 hypothetical protein K9M53_07010 [Ferruginibacter albus]
MEFAESATPEVSNTKLLGTRRRIIVGILNEIVTVQCLVAVVQPILILVQIVVAAVHFGNEKV